MYQAIYKANEEGISMPLFYNDETKRYVTMRYAHVTNNWDLRNGKDKYGVSYQYYEATRCTKYQFMDNSTDEVAYKGSGNTFMNKIFDDW